MFRLAGVARSSFVFLLWSLLAGTADAGGPVILAGHDPDDHGFTTEYAALFDEMRANVTNGGNGILSIGANTGSDAADWIQDVAALMSPPQAVTFVNNSAISTVSFSGYAILHIPSTSIDVSGGINANTEQPLLVARAVDVANFINGGGGLFGLTQDSLATAYQYLGLFAEVSSVGVDSSGSCGGSADFDNVTSTPQGQTLGITDTNIDGCCWHNAFTSYPDFLQPLATANEPSCSNPVINGLASVIGCLQCNIPGQLGLAPTLAHNLPATQHTVTATFLESTAPNDPIVGVSVSFEVVSGPNAGDSGSDTTDANGEATFTYTGDGGIGVDRIESSAVDPGTSETVESNVALKFWDLDCNGNSIPDTCDLDCNGFAGDCVSFAGCGASSDGNGNDIPDECTECDDNSDCDDGAYCNGAETCSGGDCQAGTNPCAGGSECADECNEASDTCFDAAGNSCGSATDDQCTNADTCDGAGACLSNDEADGTACGNGADTECTDADTCDGAGGCIPNDVPPGTACGSATDTECTDADTCNGVGGCSANDAPPGAACGSPTDDGCTDPDTCNGAAVCQPNHVPPGAACGSSVDDVCTNPDACDGAGVCASNDAPDETPCDDSDTCTSDDTCVGGVCTGDAQSCDDGDPCTVDDQECGPGGCAGTPLDCSYLDGQCTQGQCDGGTGECVAIAVNDGEPCDDGNACSNDDVCLSGVCSACGNGSSDGACGEECDPPVVGICDPTCKTVVCGNDVVQSGEECDDGNEDSGDGCDGDCRFEDKLCIEGLQPSVSRLVKRVVFASDHDYVGENADGNQEIYYFERRKLDKEIKQRVKKLGETTSAAKEAVLADLASRKKLFFQLTKTTAPVVNELPAINGGGRVVAFVSNGNLPADRSNADLNREIFRMDVKRHLKGIAGATVQVTDSPPGIDNLNPNLRAFKGNLLAFDSNGNLAPSACVGGENDLLDCSTNAECGAGGVCGNPEGNREVFIHVQVAFLLEGDPLRQLTAAVAGDSTVGQSVNFSTRATAFSSTADLLGVNPDANSEIYRVINKADTLTAISVGSDGQCTEPAQGMRGRVAFTSDGDFTGANPDGNREIFFWTEEDPPLFDQVGSTLGCFNALPSIDSRTRYAAFHSTCNRIPTLGNPDQSIFIWDDKKQRLLPLVVRGPFDDQAVTTAPSANAQAIKSMTILTYESNLGSVVDPAICFLNVRDVVRSLDAIP